MERFAYSSFCDDIRYEINGKFSLMGVYNALMLVSGNVPILLPKICIATTIYNIHTRPMTRVLVRVMIDNLAEPFTTSSVPLPTIESQIENAQKYPADPLNPQFNIISVKFELSQFIIERDMVIKVRVDMDDDSEIKAGALAIRVTPPPTET